MASLVQGRIIWAEFLDQNGVNPKVRPAILISSEADTPPGQPFLVVVVTTTFPKPLPETHVELPWDPHRRGVTKLGERSAAVCDWFEKVPRDAIHSVGGIVPPPKLKEILMRVHTYL